MLAIYTVLFGFLGALISGYIYFINGDKITACRLRDSAYMAIIVYFGLVLLLGV